MTAKQLKKSKLPSKTIHSKSHNRFVLMVVLVVTTFIVFFPSLQNGFVSWDDEGYILNNLHNIGKLSFTAISDLFGKLAIMGNYHPLTMIVYTLVYHFAGLNPSIYHAVNLLLHLSNVLLLFVFIYKLTNRNLVIAFITALLFSVHPLHVESVTWISETKDVLYTFFYLVALYNYLLFYEGINSYKYYVITLGAFLLSCFSKGMAVTLPMVLILIDYLKQKPFTTRLVLEKIPFFIIALIFGLLAIKAQQASEAVQSLNQFSFFEKLLFPFYGLWFYIVKMFFPFWLSIFYPYPQTGQLFWTYYAAPIATLGLVFLVYRYFRTNRMILFGLLFYVFVILPVLQIKPVGEAIVAERYFYLSSIGLFFLIGYFVEKISTLYPKPPIPRLVYACVLMLTLVYAIQTHRRTKIWKNSETLWKSVIDINPKIDKAYYSLGIFYERQKRSSDALAMYRKALEVNPKNHKALNNIGNFLYLSRNFDSANVYYSRAIATNPKFSEAFYNKANIVFAQNRFQDAIILYEKAIEANPRFMNAYNMMAKCYEKLGNKERSDYYQKKAFENREMQK